MSWRNQYEEDHDHYDRIGYQMDVIPEQVYENPYSSLASIRTGSVDQSEYYMTIQPRKKSLKVKKIHFILAVLLCCIVIIAVAVPMALVNVHGKVSPRESSSRETPLMESSSLMTSEQSALMESSSLITSEQSALTESSSLMTSEQSALMESSSYTLTLQISREVLSDPISIIGSEFVPTQSTIEMTETISDPSSDVSDLSSHGISHLLSTISESFRSRMDTSTIEISSTIEPSSSSDIASPSVLLPVYALSVEDVISVENVTTTLECRLEGNLKLNSVKFLKDEEELTGTIEQNDENTIFKYTLPSPTCTDSGIYHCMVEGEEAKLTASAFVTIQVPPGKPKVTIPFEIVEERFKEGSLFVCTYKEGIPAAQVRWTATKATEHVIELSSQNFKEENQTDECALEVTSQFYYGFTLDYNGSSVCCEVQQGNITLSACETIYIVMKDSCVDQTSRYLEHPYSRRKWIECVNEVVYMNQCGMGQCIDIASVRCGTCGDSPEPTDPFSCFGRVNEYIPRNTTYPDNCGDYSWCVNGVKYDVSCYGESVLLNDTSNGQACTNDDGESYCAHKGDSSGTTIERSSTIEPSSTYETTSPYIPLPVYTLSMDDVIGVENVTTTLVCRLKGKLTFNGVKFFKDEEELTGTIEQKDENTNFQYTLPSPTCTDSGIYYCLVEGEEANLTATANITIQVPVGKPTITVPFEIVEERFKEGSLFVCTYKEGIPAAQVRWTATNTTEHVLELLSHNSKEKKQTDECALEATSQFYHGFALDYNGSSVCCEVQQGNISFSSCETIYIVDKDFCINKTNQIYEHPYSRRTWISCVNDVVYMNQCGVGYCINIATGACEDCGDSPEPTDPLSCVGRNYAYIPRESTYPDNCGDYHRCVNGDKQPGTCAGSFLSNDTSSFLCTNKYEESYCAHVGGDKETSTASAHSFRDHGNTNNSRPI